MNNLQVFKNEEFGEIRTATRNNEPIFCLVDVCRVLEIGNSRQAKTRLNEDGVISNDIIDSLGRTQSADFISESNLYKLIFQSRKPQAEKFSDWVTSEVLPSIRKHGAYMTEDVLEKAINNPDFMIGLLQNLKQEREARITAERKNAILMHTNKTYTATEIAKELGFKSAVALNKDLCEKGIQYKVNKTYVLYSKYTDMGLVSIKQQILDNGKEIYNRHFTQTGREFLLSLYNINEG